jgi:iron complex outermembrane receptor protein
MAAISASRLITDVVAWAAFGARSGNESNILALPTVTSSDSSSSTYRFDSVRTGEIGVRGKLYTGDIKHTLSATASIFQQKSRNAYAFSDFSGFAGNMYRPLDVAVADTLSMFNDSVLLTVGARRQTIKSDSFDYNSGASLSRYDENRVTPVAAIVYKPVQGVSLYANYIEGLQQGPVASGTNVSNIGESFVPFVSRQKEIGIKVGAGRVGFSAALFSITLPSAYVQNGRFGVFGEQRNEGLELSVFGAPLRGVRVLGGLTLLDAKPRTMLGAVNQGKDVIGVPDTQLNLGAEWDVPALRALTLTARTLYTATQYADGANTQQLSSWTRIDLGASYATRIVNQTVTLRAHRQRR